MRRPSMFLNLYGFFVCLIGFFFWASTAKAQPVSVAIDVDLDQPGIQDTAEVEFGRKAQGAVILSGFAQDLLSYTVVMGASPSGGLLCADTQARVWFCDVIYGTDASTPLTDIIGRIYRPPDPPCLALPPADPLELFVFEICPITFPLQLRFASTVSVLEFNNPLGRIGLNDARVQINSATLTGFVPTPTPTVTRTPTRKPPPRPTRTPTPVRTPTHSPTPLRADLDRDGRVDSTDLLLLLEQWRKRPPPAEE